MTFIAALIAVPLVAAIMLLLIRDDKARAGIVWVAAAATAALSIVTAVIYMPEGWVGFEFASPAIDMLCTVIGVAIAAVIVRFAIAYRNVLAFVLAIVQLAGSLAFEFGFAHGLEVEMGLYTDGLSLLMVLIIGIIGSGICVYAIGYMRDFQAHEPEGASDRRPFFFFLMFLFLSAMFVIVLSNNMVWMFTGWEITTLCSFLLIGYTRTDEAIRNAFRQINMNLVGGIAFVIALFASAVLFDTLDFAEFLETATFVPAFAVLPASALAIAALTKAAQMPFHTWLLGAMVAPTPTSALLHSSTMVKAGVFLLIKIAPVLAVCPVPQVMVEVCGTVTFLLCSCMAISQTNAKRVLAYSTIANLGLIALCAGLGTAEAVWAAMFLLLFHAAAKSLLFLCVGTAEHHIGSRDIEDMDLLFERMPRLARFMMLGIMVMFIAPFGMLLSKWAVIVSLIEAGAAPLFLLVAFGSAATFMFWAKWIGKLSGIAGSPENVERTVYPSEWAAQGLMVAIALIACVTMPLISNVVVEPYINNTFGVPTQSLADGNLWICAIATVVIVVVLTAGLGRSRTKRVDVYLSGVAIDNDERTFRDSLSGETKATVRNMYLDNVFGERPISAVGSVLCAAAMVVSFVVSVVPVLFWL